MKTTIRYTVLLIFLFIWGYSSAQRVSTGGDRSPAVWANSVSIAYGFSYKHIIQLEALFKEKGLDKKQREQKVVSLVNRFRLGLGKIEDKKAAPTEKQVRQWLGVEASDDIIGLFTSGAQSPAVIGNQVRISYGLSEQEFWGLFEYFERTDSVIKRQKYLLANKSNLIRDQGRLLDKEKDEFEQLLKRFKELEKELSFRSDDMAKEAKKLLEEGKIEDAQKVLVDRYYFTIKQDERAQQERALAAFDAAVALELDPTKYREANPFYADAVKQEPENTNYINKYCINLIRLGKYDAVIPLYKKAIWIDSLEYGAKNTSVSTFYNNLGLALGAKGKYDLAIGFYKKSLGIDTVLHGVMYPKVATSYNNLGEALKENSKYERAIECFEMALRIDTFILGSYHPSVATNYNSLGAIWGLKGNYDKAINYFEKALRIDTTALGLSHPNVSLIYNNLGHSWHSKGEYDIAIKYLEKALEISKVGLGLKHPNIATIYSNLGVVMSSKAEYKLAVEYYNKALEIDTTFYGAMHPNVARQYRGLGDIKHSEGKYDLAIEYFEKALKIDMKTFGMKHPNMATNYNHLGLTWRYKGDYDTAIFYYEKALNAYSRGN